MKKMTKLILLMVSIFCIGMLSGCSDPQDELMILMVKGDLDAMYLNQFDEAYLNMCDMTKEEANNGMQKELNMMRIISLIIGEFPMTPVSIMMI